jgi:hypothetical protein
MENLEENKLRECVRGIIQYILNEEQEKNKLVLEEENKLRTLIRNIIILETDTPDNDPAPSRSTGINVLEDLLKKVIPVLETDYKSLTTEVTQRKSFRAHVINAVENTLTPPRINDKAGEPTLESDLSEEDINVDLGTEDESFIPIDDKYKPEEPSEEEQFGIQGQDETGRNVAFNTFKKIEANILDAYDLLSNDKDKNLFYDYLLTNLKLYFDKFEDDLAPSVEEPTTSQYEKETGDAAKDLNI